MDNMEIVKYSKHFTFGVITEPDGDNVWKRLVVQEDNIALKWNVHIGFVFRDAPEWTTKDHVTKSKYKEVILTCFGTQSYIDRTCIPEYIDVLKDAEEFAGFIEEYANKQGYM